MTDALDNAKEEANAQLALANEWYAGLTSEALVIHTDEQQANAAKVLQKVKLQYDVIEKRRTEITGPLNQALRSVNDLFRPPREKFQAIESMLKDAITRYLADKQAANVAALQAAAVAPTPQAAQEALSVVAPVAPPAGVSVRKVWKFVVEDADRVPRSYCSPDPDKIKRADPTTPIPGVRFYEEASVAVRRK